MGGIGSEIGMMRREMDRIDSDRVDSTVEVKAELAELKARVDKIEEQLHSLSVVEKAGVPLEDPVEAPERAGKGGNKKR